MSIKALQWARPITTGRASFKAVLICLADTHHKQTDECYASMAYLSQYTELNQKTIRAAIKWLDEAGLITEQRRPGLASLFILNQDQAPEEITPASGAGNPGNLLSAPAKIGQGETPSKNGSDPCQKDLVPLPILEDIGVEGELRGKNPPKDPPAAIANRVIEYLNQVTGKNYRATESNRENIKARLAEGYTEEDCRTVIDGRYRRWSGTSQAQYLRPQTLFRPSKFDGYLNDAGETGMPDDDQKGYDPSRTQAQIGEMFGSGQPDPFALPPGGTHGR